MSPMLDEVFQRIPKLRNDDDEQGKTLKIDAQRHQAYLAKCEELSSYLENDPKRFDAISELNNELNDAITKSNTDKKQLSGILSTNELKEGIRLGDSEVVTYLGFVNPDLFRKQLQEGRQWKDPTVPEGHGESTHRIQWYMITRKLSAPDGGWNQFYKWIGLWKHTVQMANDRKAEFWLSLGLWDALVDRNTWNGENVNGPYNTSGKQDFRSPESLYAYLIDDVNKSKIANLWEVINKRNTKLAPMLKNTTAGAKAKKEYLAGKLYKSTWAALDDMEKLVIDYNFFGTWIESPIMQLEIAARNSRDQSLVEKSFPDALETISGNEAKLGDQGNLDNAEKRRRQKRNELKLILYLLDKGESLAQEHYETSLEQLDEIDAQIVAYLVFDVMVFGSMDLNKEKYKTNSQSKTSGRRSFRRELRKLFNKYLAATDDQRDSLPFDWSDDLQNLINTINSNANTVIS